MAEKPLAGRPGGIYWHLLQNNSAAEIVFNRFIKQFPRSSWNQLWAKKPNESEKTVYLTGYREIHFKSGSEPHNLRAETLDGGILDECREQDKIVWTQILRPMLARRHGWCQFYSTPNGFDWFYDLHNDALLNPNEWGVVHAPSTEAWWWTEDEILSAKKTMSEAEFAQEIMAEFRDLTAGKVYVSAGVHNHSVLSPLTKDGLLHPMLPIIVGMDFNVGFMNWTLGQKKVDQFHWHDELCITNTYTQEQTNRLIEKIKPLNHKPGVIIVGDASGKANRTSAVGQSDYDIIFQSLSNAGIPFMNMTPESNPNIKDRVNTVNAKLRDAAGNVHMTYDPNRCPALKKDFDRVLWKMTSNSERIVEDQTKDPSLTHSSSGVGYAVCALSPLQYGNDAGILRVIRR